MGVTVDSSSAIQALKKLGRKYQPAERKAVEQASIFVAKKLENNTPVFDGKKSQGKKGSYMLKKAKDEVVRSKTKKGSSEIGYSDDVAWRMHFVEFGTINQRPQGFVLRTQREVEQEVIKIMTNVLSEELMK